MRDIEMTFTVMCSLTHKVFLYMQAYNFLRILHARKDSECSCWRWQFFTVIDVHIWGSLPHEWSRKQAQLSHLATGAVARNWRACARLPGSWRAVCVCVCVCVCVWHSAWRWEHYHGRLLRGFVIIFLTVIDKIKEEEEDDDDDDGYEYDDDFCQQNGVSHHFSHEVRSTLKAIFLNRWIRRGGPTPWPFSTGIFFFCGDLWSLWFTPVKSENYVICARGLTQV